MFKNVFKNNIEMALFKRQYFVSNIFSWNWDMYAITQKDESEGKVYLVNAQMKFDTFIWKELKRSHKCPII